MKVLFITRHTPFPGEDGAGAYAFDILRFLYGKGVAIELFWLQPNESIKGRGWYLVPRAISGLVELNLPGQLRIGPLRIFPGVYYGKWEARVLNWLKIVLRAVGVFELLRGDQPPVPVGTTQPPFERDPIRNWMALPTDEEITLTKEQILRTKPDVVFVNYCWMNELFACIPKRSVPRICVTHDVAHHRAEMLASIKGSKVLRSMTMQEEARLLQIADLIVAISEADAKVFKKMIPSLQVVITPKAVNAERLPGVSIPGRLLFVGSNNQPNREGLTWFLESVWPLLLRARPTAHLEVCGSIGDAFCRPYSQVAFSGKVPDLRGAYAKAEVVIVPLLSGSGMKIKLVEAFSFGKACVTTSVGLQGVPFLTDATLCADDEAGFAAAVGRILEDSTLRQGLEAASLLAAKTHLSREQSYAALWQWMVTHSAAEVSRTNSAGAVAVP